MLIRVFEIPDVSATSFLFSGGKPASFLQVDWFRDECGMMATEEGRKQIETFIKGKVYYNPGAAYLVLHECHTFTFGYTAP